MGQPVQQGGRQAFTTQHSRPFRKGQVGSHQDRALLVALAEDFKQQFGAGLGEGHVAQFVDYQELDLAQLRLQAQQRLFIAGLDQSIDQKGTLGQ